MEFITDNNMEANKVDYYELQSLKNEEYILENRYMQILDNQSDGWRIDCTLIYCELEVIRKKIDNLQNN